MVEMHNIFCYSKKRGGENIMHFWVNAYATTGLIEAIWGIIHG